MFWSFECSRFLFPIFQSFFKKFLHFLVSNSLKISHRAKRKIRILPETINTNPKPWWIIYYKLIMKYLPSKDVFGNLTVGFHFDGWWSSSERTRTQALSFYCQIVGWRIQGEGKTIIIPFVLIESSLFGRESLKPKQIASASSS